MGASAPFSAMSPPCRSPRPFSSASGALLTVILQIVFLVNFSLIATDARSRTIDEMAELARSKAWYEESINSVANVRGLLQVNDERNEHQEDGKSHERNFENPDENGKDPGAENMAVQEKSHVEKPEKLVVENLKVESDVQQHQQGPAIVSSLKADEQRDEQQRTDNMTLQETGNEGVENKRNEQHRQAEDKNALEIEPKAVEQYQQAEVQQDSETKPRTEKQDKQAEGHKEPAIKSRKGEEDHQAADQIYSATKPKKEEHQQLSEDQKLADTAPETKEQHKQVKDQKTAAPESKLEGQQPSQSESSSRSSDSDQNKHEGKAEDQQEERKEKPFEFPAPYLLAPPIKDWDEQRKGWQEVNPEMNSANGGKPRVLIVTGSKPGPCSSPGGDNFHIRSLKLKIDYARIHKYEIYYNFAHLDPLFDSYWVKLPTIRKLMLTHPEIEWFFWVDSDAFFTDILFEIPLDTYGGYNMVMWGIEEGLFIRKSWVAYNVGVFLIRNCQWSLDLIDKWSPFGPRGPVRNEYGKVLTSFMSNRKGNYPADDQSALAYLMIKDKDLRSRIKLVDTREYMVSAYWLDVVDKYEECMEKYRPGLGNQRWPWITHFTGCGPCDGSGGARYQKCMTNIERAYNFADNQVLAYMGFRHESLFSQKVVRTRNETDRPLDFVDVDPWADRISVTKSLPA